MYLHDINQNIRNKRDGIDIPLFSSYYTSISSVESQKGGIIIQPCAIENQKGTSTMSMAIAVLNLQRYRLSGSHWNFF